MTDASPAAAHQVPPNSQYSRYAAPLLLLAISTAVFFVPLLAGRNDVPGDLGDNRFNIYVLEHIWRWLTGLDQSLLSLPIFFPYPYTFGFSDVHVGSVAFYAAFRFIGWNEYDAFKAWLVIGYVLTFIASYLVLLRLSISPWLAAIGAFAFAFSLPALVQVGHAQLTYRLGVPLALYSALRYAQSKRPLHLMALIGWTSLQMLINIYLGFFTLMVAGIVFVVALLIEHPFSRGWFRSSLGMLREPLLRRNAHRLGPVVVTLAVFGAALALLGFYGFVSWLYGFGRSWPEILTMVPRPWSYLLLDSLPYWSHISAALPSITMRGEQQLFLGIPVTLLFLVATGYVIIRPGSASPALRLFIYSSLVLALVMTKIGPLTLYWVVAQLPGFEALRAVSRFQLVGAFPIVAACVLFIQQVTFLDRWRPVLVGLLALWLVGDVNMIGKSTFSSQESRARIDAVVAQAGHASSLDGSVLAFRGDPAVPPYINQIDAMFAAARLGIPTLNGYSGNFVPGYEYVASCDGFIRQLSIYDGWAKAHRQPSLDSLWRPVTTAGAEPCQVTRELVAANEYSEGPAPDATAAKAIRLADASVARQGPTLIIDVNLVNGTAQIIHSGSANPLLLSWRLFADGATPPGWETRVSPGADIPAGATRAVHFAIDGAGHKAGDHLQLSFVVEAKFWGHDIGAAPVDLVLP